MKNNTARNSVRGLKYIPVGAFLLMFFHVILLHLGIDFPVSEILVILSGYYLTFMFSKTFGFCLLHRMLIYYALTMMMCIWMRRFPSGEYGLFGDYIWHARGFMLAIGLLLFILLAIKKFCSIEKKKDAE